jgi:molecular chaperone IbpA
MQVLDFAPLSRSTVGFDRLFQMLEGAARGAEGDAAYPPYNIERTGEDGYRVTIAVAGFRDGELSVTQQQNQLIVSGKQAADETATTKRFLHRGIAARAFERRFNLADYVRVTSAALDHGLLVIDLAREVPEAAKPRRIDITGAAPTAVLEQRAAA